MGLYYTWAFVVVISYVKNIYNSYRFCRINSFMRWVICHKYFYISHGLAYLLGNLTRQNMSLPKIINFGL